MKLNKLKAILLALVTLVTLTSCKLIDNIIGSILVNTAMKLDVLVNRIDILPSFSDTNPKFVPFEEQPTKEDNRAELNYFKNVLVIPRNIDAVIYNRPVKLHFDFEFNEEAAGAFRIIDVSEDKLPDNYRFDTSGFPFPVTYDISIIVPVGESTILDEVTSIEEVEDILKDTPRDELLDIVEQDPLDATIKVIAKSAAKKKSKNYYFNLSKPPFGTMVLDEVFDSSYLINLYRIKGLDTDSLEVEAKLENVADLPTDSAEPLYLSYFLDTLAIPKKITAKDLGDVTFNVETNRPDLLFIAEMTKSINDLDPENELIEGDVTVTTLTPVGGYNEEIPADVNTVDEFKDHLKGVDTKDLYPYTTQDSKDFTITITATCLGEEKTETYYFTMEEAPLDEEIIDYIIKDNSLLNVISYEDVEEDAAINSIASEAKDPLNPYPIEHLVDTLIVPEKIILTDFGNKELLIETEISSSNTDALNFYEASKSATISENEVTAKTLTPLGTYDASEVTPDDLTALANSIKALPTKDLYNASQAEGYDVTLNVTVTLVTETGELLVREVTFYLQTTKADVDEKIGTAIMDDHDIVNIIDHTNPYTNVANPPQPTDPSNPYELLYFGETLVFPIDFEYADFTDKVIHFDVDVNGKEDLFFISQKTHTYEGQEIEGMTFSPIGTYEPAETLSSYSDLINHLQNPTNLEAINAARLAQVSEDVQITVTISIDGRTVAVNDYYFVLVVTKTL